MSTRITVKAKSKERHLRLSELISSGETAFVSFYGDLMLIVKDAIFSTSSGYRWTEPNASFTVKCFCDINLIVEEK